MSFRVISEPSPESGVHLEVSIDLSAPQFLIHECGFLGCVDNWNSRGEVMGPFWCLWHALDDGQWIESHGARWELGPKRLVLAPAQVIYTARSRQPAPQLWLHFSLVPDYVLEAPTPFSIPLNALLCEQVNALRKACNKVQEKEAHILYHHAAALLNTCFACHTLPLRALPEALRAVLHLIESAPAENLSNARLAHLSGLSISSFIRWFEAHMQQSPAAYVRHVRYQQASRMLIFSEASIEQIAAELGYPNRHYFSRAFAKYAGCGPATFRKNLHRQARL